MTDLDPIERLAPAWTSIKVEEVKATVAARVVRDYVPDLTARAEILAMLELTAAYETLTEEGETP